MFDGHWKGPIDKALRPVGRSLHRAGLSADHLTAAGMVIAAAAAVAIGAGATRLGLLLLLLAALPDLLDGALAKAAGAASARGAFFDSVADRVTDSLLFGGVAWHFASDSGAHAALLPFAVMGVSSVISYQRAKAESLGFEAKGGLMERAERIILLAFGLLFEFLLVAVLWVMLTLTVVTAVQRFAKVWAQASAVRPRPEPRQWKARRVARPSQRAWQRASQRTERRRPR